MLVACLTAVFRRGPRALLRYCSSSAGSTEPAAPVKKTRRRGYVVSCDISGGGAGSATEASPTPPPPPVLSDACGHLRSRFGRDVGALVEAAVRPSKPGQLLLVPGGLGRDADGFVVDLCVLGVGPGGAGAPEKVPAGAEAPEPWEAREDLRSAVRQAVTALRDLGCSQVLLDATAAAANVEDIAEAAQSAAVIYPKHRGERRALNSGEESEPPGADTMLIGRIQGNAGNPAAWDYGLTLGLAESRARNLMERPANLCTPEWFCRQAADAAAAVGPQVQVQVHEQDWIEQRGMGGLLAVAKGSRVPPRFLLARYNGRPQLPPPQEGQEPPPQVTDVCLVGKGVTFDSGGISIKPSANMAAMRGDMGGAAVALSAFLAACQLRLPLSLALCAPLCENMPDGAAVKPGDVVELASGLTVRVDNTDAEGRLLLADALYYASASLRPRLIVDLATLTGAISIALGSHRAGLFANRAARLAGHDRRLVECGFERGDPLHTMPVDRRYRAAVHDRSGLADLSNIATPDRQAGSCTAAGFLSHFVPPETAWLHVDMAGVMDTTEGRMTGRPARALVHFLRRLAEEQQQQ